MRRDLIALIYCTDLDLASLQADLQREKINLTTIDDLDNAIFNDNERLKILLVDESKARLLDKNGLRQHIEHSQPMVVLGIGDEESFLDINLGEHLFCCLKAPLQHEEFYRSLRGASLFLQERRKSMQLNRALNERTKEMTEVNKIGIALSVERDHDRLLEMILLKSREITNADAGSLYLVETKPTGERHLMFKLSQNDSVEFNFSEYLLPIDNSSMAGHVAMTGESINIEDVYDLHTHNRSFDEKIGYRTKSVLTVPMKNHKSEIIGVLQLINRKKNKEITLYPPYIAEKETIPFDDRCAELIMSLASQAAVAIENNQLYENIQRLFEGFVTASVTAIEQRDPTTSGHSQRVATLTIGLAETVDRITEGPYRLVKFSRDHIKELRYASLLHDFGKVGVRENILVKAKKLYPDKLELIKARFDFIKKQIESEYSRKKIDYLLRQGQQNYISHFQLLDHYMAEELNEVDRYIQLVINMNEPIPAPWGSFEQLVDIATRTYRDISGKVHHFLEEDEVRILSIRKGSLDDRERLDVESHVTHSFHFLKNIPWMNELKDIPRIAYAHHEKLNGKGYPNRLVIEEIPLQSRMITISDIYDALTAWDRPYKKSVSVEQALDILKEEAENGFLDTELVRIFINEKIYTLVAKNDGRSTDL
ncbi:MAG: GAF domain-containing protein [Deltaproteobacteria bacterium]|nr:GAF domain-containing protein [Deltaproteobacteria bacterium]